MMKNSDDISLMQSLLRQINETGQTGNETLTEMLNILMDIREQNKNTNGVIPIPISQGNNGNSGINYSSPPSSEMSALGQGF